jgi:hypothetical protein
MTREGVAAILFSTEAEGRSVLLEHEVYGLLASAGIKRNGNRCACTHGM